MRRWFTTLVLLLALSLPAASHAAGMNNLYAGINSITTFWLDPIWLTVSPPEQLEDLPGYPVTGRICGLVGGTLQGSYRLLAGATDIVTFPFWVMPVYSPEPRFALIPDVEGYLGTE